MSETTELIQEFTPHPNACRLRLVATYDKSYAEFHFTVVGRGNNFENNMFTSGLDSSKARKLKEKVLDFLNSPQSGVIVIFYSREPIDGGDEKLIIGVKPNHGRDFTRSLNDFCNGFGFTKPRPYNAYKQPPYRATELATKILDFCYKRLGNKLHPAYRDGLAKQTDELIQNLEDGTLLTQRGTAVRIAERVLFWANKSTTTLEDEGALKYFIEEFITEAGIKPPEKSAKVERAINSDSSKIIATRLSELILSSAKLIDTPEEPKEILRDAIQTELLKLHRKPTAGQGVQRILEVSEELIGKGHLDKACPTLNQQILNTLKKFNVISPVNDRSA